MTTSHVGGGTAHVPAGTDTVVIDPLTVVVDAPIVPPPGPGPVPAPGGQTARVDVSTNPTVFLNAMANPSVGKIELSGQFCHWEALPWLNRGGKRNVLVTPVPGQKVTFVGPGKTIGDGIFHGADHVMFDGLVPDGFIFDGIKEACTGLINCDGSLDYVWQNVTTRNLSRDNNIGSGPVPWKTWIVYMSGARNHLTYFRKWTVEQPTLWRDQSGFSIGSTSVQMGEVGFTDIIIKGQSFAFIDWQVPVENLILERWTVDDCQRQGGGASMRLERPLSGTIKGHMKDIHATRSGPWASNVNPGDFVDLGGSSWA